MDAAALAELAAWTVERALEIQAIPAPTFSEERRARKVAADLEDLGLKSVHMDALGNVYAKLPAESSRACLMISAHTDTVFPSNTNLAVTRGEDRLTGPGLGDNSIGVAALEALARFLVARSRPPATDVQFVATTGEEGLGDLRGMRAAFAKVRPDAVLNIEGLTLGSVCHRGIAVKRLHVTTETAGGHSWMDFGRPSAVHSIARIAARICELRVPETPRTTFNVGVIEGGRSVNTIASSAGLWLDMRSEEPGALETVERDVQRILESERETTVSQEVVSQRPAGAISADHPLVRMAVEALAAVGRGADLRAGSTDGNIPLAAGCPAVTVGVTEGANAHREDEHMLVSPVRDGLFQLIALTEAAAEWLPQQAHSVYE